LLVGASAAMTTVQGDLWKPIVLAADAGALGATLSGVFRVRDQLRRLDELRAFHPAMYVQPLIGACAGLIVLLVLESNAVSFNAVDAKSAAARGLLAFAAGFSEPFFLGIVERVAMITDRDRPAAKAA
jgi:hypothetical protein